MHWVLIFIVVSLTNPNQPAMLGHKLVKDQATCELVAAKVKEDTEKKISSDVVVKTFCSSTWDLVSN